MRCGFVDEMAQSGSESVFVIIVDFESSGLLLR